MVESSKGFTGSAGHCRIQQALPVSNRWPSWFPRKPLVLSNYPSGKMMALLTPQDSLFSLISKMDEYRKTLLSRLVVTIFPCCPIKLGFIPRKRWTSSRKSGILPCFEPWISIFRISPGVGLRCNTRKHIPIKQHSKPSSTEGYTESNLIQLANDGISSSHQQAAGTVHTES